MELLRQENPVNNKLVKSITIVLSDYLVKRFGYHPSMHYKDVIARSLVSKYNSLKSSKAAIPHALWFYPHGRGQGKHSGKIHYHIEYMVKKDKQQIHQPRRHGNVDIIDGDDNNMLQTDDNNQNDPAMIEKLKYIVPTDASLDVIKSDWIQTFGARKNIRDNSDDTKLVDEMLEAFPLTTEFNGSLIAVDFELMFSNAGDFNETWDILQSKILGKHRKLHSYIKSQFVRTLLIVRDKNPSRGVKRAIPGPQQIVNGLDRIIEWINPEDDVEQFAVGYSKTKLPILIVKAPQYEEGAAYIRLNRRVFSWRAADGKLQYALFGMFTLSLEIISIFAILLGIIVNGYILLIVTLTKQIAYVNKILLLHLGVVNTLICFTYLTFYVMTLLNLLILVDIACILFGLSFNIMHSVALWNLCALNFDRYFAIASPLHYGALINTKKVLIGLGCGWGLSILFSLPQLLLVSPYHYDTYYEVCVPNFITSGSLVYNTSLTAFTIFLPIILILGCNMKVLMIARYQRHRIASAILEVTLSAQLTITHQRNPFFIPSFSSQVVQNSTSLKNHTHSPMSTIFQLVGSIFIIYCPYYICSLWNNTVAVIQGDNEWNDGIKQNAASGLMIPKIALQISVTFLLMSPFINALFYGIKNKVIKKSFHNFWRKQKSKIEIHYEIQARTPSTCGSRRPSINEMNSAQPLLNKQLSETFMNMSKVDISNKQSDIKLRSESLWSSNSKLSSYSVLNSPTGNLTATNLTPISSNESKFVYLNPISTSSIPSTISSTYLHDSSTPITSSSTSKITCNIMNTVKHYSSHSTKPKIKITKTFSEEKQPSPKQGIDNSLDDVKTKGITSNTKSLFNLEHADDNLVMVTTERIYAPKELTSESKAGTINSFTFKKYASLQEISITSATVTICDILK